MPWLRKLVELIRRILGNRPHKVVSETKKPEVNEMEKPDVTWEATAEQLETLWNQIYTRIIGFSWLWEPYAHKFEGNEKFRKSEINRIGRIVVGPGWKFPQRGDLKISLRSQAKLRTDFILTRKALILPWPQEPDPEEDPENKKLYEAFSFARGRKRVVLPGTQSKKLEEQPEDVAAPAEENGKILADLIDILSGHDRAISDRETIDPPPANHDGAFPEKRVIDAWLGHPVDENLGSGPEHNGADHKLSCRCPKARHSETTEPTTISDDAYIFGDDLWDLLDQLPGIIARVWADPLYKEAYREDPLDKVTDIDLPSKAVMKYSVPQDGAITDVTITYEKSANGEKWEMQLPMPEKPPVDSIFMEFIAGTASNPLYSNCY